MTCNCNGGGHWPSFPGLIAAVGGSEDPTVETVSHFWRGQPNDLAFVQRAPGATPSPSDPKLRFWRTEFVTVDGLRAFVAALEEWIIATLAAFWWP